MRVVDEHNGPFWQLPGGADRTSRIGNGVLGVTELYDEITGTWASAGTGMWSKWGTLTKMTDGRVLHAGGWGGTELSSAFIYTPGSGWASTGSMTGSLCACSAPGSSGGTACAPRSASSPLRLLLVER